LEWGADEELLLLEAAETYGLGNWEDISEHIGTKTLEECRNHYLETYIASENWPLPNLSQEFDPSIDTLINRRTYKPKKKQYKTLVSQPTNHEIGGFMPGRLEFELEYENEAENIIKDLIINEDDTNDEFNLKLSLLEIYNSKLEKREYRKRFCLDRNYFEFKKVQAIEKKRSKEEKAIHSKLKPFTKLQTNSDMENFVNGLLIEDKLKYKISQLQNLITNGLTNMEHLDQFNADIQARTPIEPHAIIDEPAEIIQQSTTHNTRSTRQNAGENSEEVRTIGRKQAAPLDISGSDGIELLTQEEQSICSTLRLLPKPYLVIKETLIRECATRGFLRRRQARDLVKIDVNKTSRLYDFFFRMGWVYSTPKH
jgi:transcriptional adapter 2-alpha